MIPIFSSYNVFIVLMAFLFFKESLSRIQSISVAMVIISITMLK
ncbi:MAG: hypothetical protein AB1427_08290 [Thermodesulfobacteriota bacterium]